MITALSSIRAQIPINQIIFYAYMARSLANIKDKFEILNHALTYLSFLRLLFIILPFSIIHIAYNALSLIINLPKITPPYAVEIFFEVDAKTAELLKIFWSILSFVNSVIILGHFIGQIPRVQRKIQAYNLNIAPEFWQICDLLAKDDLIAFIKHNNYYLSPNKTVNLLSYKHINVEYRMLYIARQVGAIVIARAIDMINKDRDMIIILLQVAYNPNSSMYNLPLDAIKTIAEFNYASNMAEFNIEARTGANWGIFHNMRRFMEERSVTCRRVSHLYSEEDNQHLTYFYAKHKQSLLRGINNVDNFMQTRKVPSFTPMLDMQKEEVTIEWDIEAAMMIPVPKYKSGFKLKTN